MLIDLPTILKQQGRKAPLHLDMPMLPKQFEEELQRIFLEAFRELVSGIAARAVAAYSQQLAMQADEAPEDVLDDIDRGRVSVLLGFRRKWKKWAESAKRAHFGAIVRKLRYASGLDVSSAMPLHGGESTLEALLEWNVGLIRNISDDYRNKISGIIQSGITTKKPPAIIAKEIREATDIGAKRAKRIAVDQTTKLNSALDAQRMTDLGFEGYEWMHSGKAHPRIEHKERNGKYIKFGSEIDKTDPPGYAPFCGCKRKAVIK